MFCHTGLAGPTTSMCAIWPAAGAGAAAASAAAAAAPTLRGAAHPACLGAAAGAAGPAAKTPAAAGRAAPPARPPETGTAGPTTSMCAICPPAGAKLVAAAGDAASTVTWPPGWPDWPAGKPAGAIIPHSHRVARYLQSASV